MQANALRIRTHRGGKMSQESDAGAGGRSPVGQYDINVSFSCPT